jgi:hypothetical protein
VFTIFSNFRSDDSEDDWGRPVYLQEKDKDFLSDQKDIRKLQEDQVKQMKTENEYLRSQGRPLLKVTEQLSQKTMETYYKKWESYKNAFYENTQLNLPASTPSP